MRTSAFSLLEAMVAIAIAGVVAATTLATFKTALDAQGGNKAEWQAFTIAEQRMELLSALPRSHPSLDENVASATPGDEADMVCAGAPASARVKVNSQGVADAAGRFEVCTKVTVGKPEGALKTIRVIVEFLNEQGVADRVSLITVR